MHIEFVEIANFRKLRSTRVSFAKDSKAELALDLLEFEDASKLRPPTYIREGLLWLAEQLRQRQKELGLAIQETVAPKAEAA